ncbi:MAG: class I SAM-dependent methyltransferase [Candidatus Hydrogenedentes bacterium]|nr:class I SAM-dependent methyltransferase [Candidatus Hydrogenedentota bacterium]
MEIFSPEFYSWMREGSLRSAREIVPLVRRFVRTDRVVDIACGTGEWLKVFRDHGSSGVLGVDADWVLRNKLVIEREEFIVADITRTFAVPGKFDLALMLEAIQHVPAGRARETVRTLTDLAPAVLLSAPIPYQGGSGDDVHEQWPEYWAKLFSEVNYVCIDAIRPQIWMNERVEWWYSQNMILYVRKDQLDLNSALRAAYESTPNPPQRLVHPKLYESRSIPWEQPEGRVERIARGAYRRVRTAFAAYKTLWLCAYTTPTATILNAFCEMTRGVSQIEMAIGVL